MSFIEQRALVVLLRVPNDANAFKMFETLNDRGLRTSQALIKNYLFSRAGDRVDEVRNRWSYLHGTLESLDEGDNIIVDFLRHALITIRGHNTRESQVYDAVQERVKSDYAAIKFTARLEHLANAYVATFNSEHERWNDPDATRRSLEVLNMLNIRAPHADGGNEGVRTRRDGCGVPVCGLSWRKTAHCQCYPQWLGRSAGPPWRTVSSKDVETARDLKGRLNGVTPGDEEFRSRSRRSGFGATGTVLSSSAGDGWFIPTQDRSVINLEHVLPKKPEDWPRFTTDEAAMYVNRLGNQVLLQASRNSNLRNVGFPEKKRLYAESPYRLTSMLAEVDDWTPRPM